MSAPRTRLDRLGLDCQPSGIRRFFALVALASLGLFRCSTPPTDETLSGTPPACDTCHKPEDRQTTISTLDIRAWMQQKGQGLTRRVGLMTSSVYAFGLDVVSRGHHPLMPPAECAACHPVSSDGARHGLAQYPTQVHAAAVTGGQDCGPTCHTWLKPQATVTGFTPKTGSAPMVTGSIRPYDLLAASKDSHATVFHKGFSRTSADTGLLVGRIGPGCAGCHGIHNDKHGSTPGCLDCHTLGGSTGSLHKAHIDAITKGQPDIDPQNSAKGSCDYCHGLTATAGTLKNAACYNCHLSGHQVKSPTTAKPHFWPITP